METIRHERVIRFSLINDFAEPSFPCSLHQQYTLCMLCLQSRQYAHNSYKRKVWCEHHWVLEHQFLCCDVTHMFQNPHLVSELELDWGLGGSSGIDLRWVLNLDRLVSLGKLQVALCIYMEMFEVLLSFKFIQSFEIMASVGLIFVNYSCCACRFLYLSLVLRCIQGCFNPE